MFSGVINMLKMYPWSMGMTVVAIIVGGGTAIFFGIRNEVRKRRR